MQVTRWKRYGKDRLYVAADEAQIGYWDLVTDEAHAETPEHLPTLVEAVEDWRASHTGQITAAEPIAVVPNLVPAADPPQPRATVPSRVVTPDVPSTHRPWLDLTTNRPGAEAREQALAAREAAPVKTLLARALRVHTEERAWRIGADGEELVAAQLVKAAKKDPRWRFIHAIPVGNRGSDIDHLVIGPGGIFTVNTKHHPQAKIWVGGTTFMVDGHKQPYIRNSRYEAARAARLLTAACGFPVHVEGLIVTVNAQDVVVKKAPDGVHVTPRMQVAKWLLRHGDLLSVDTVDAIHDVARRSTTWQP